ncbi:hypothetical protein L2719_08420 [Shewanella schlegeliana]|uniref:Heavy metal binding domain-containing protein n=1 Tax=Shewanella schlegeliana TaxID=190308 RepID=A0ABS1T1F8_9GAMM|nr:heavy metal-binding domain-containing protein [Shewanella schlegeliana]MBL4914622.1 hypothetical protein [Shewanella schlegeliana]MCL1109562.1 hypothetical protein [Shewanella schlegeliana]GIU29716.1 hypothetical protein TUM4433_19300 [Shewanella schlegeliana]
MKTLISLALSALLLLSWTGTASANEHHHGAHKNQHAVQSQDYACPMHPEVTGSKGDSCPKCGMDLEAAKTATKGHAKNCDSCPNKESCPNKAKKHHQHMSKHTHACPMNPAITGQAGDSCPKCGMDLEPIAKADNAKNCDSCPNKESCPNKAKKHHQHMSKHTHACPMNPAITGQAGDSCPKCGMDLEPIATGDKATKSAHKHH